MNKRLKYLSDEDILSWNSKIPDFTIYPKYNNSTGYPNINISNNVNFIPVKMDGSNLTYDSRAFNNQGILERIPDISYILTFSISKNRSEYFFRLLGELRDNARFYTKCTINEQIYDIKIDEKIISSIEQYDHTISNREFIRYKYTFEGPIPNIMGYVSYIEDAIAFFQLLWGYDEEGNEISLIEFTIGSLVSLKKNRSEDYLVIDYDFIFYDKKPIINYIITRIFYDSSSTVIKYGEILSVEMKELVFSRNGKIDDILS